MKLFGFVNVISSVRKGDLDKNPKSCNNCKGKDRRKYEIGDKYGLLTIIGNAPCKNNKTYVKVQCDCGSKPFEVRLEHQSCSNYFLWMC